VFPYLPTNFVQFWRVKERLIIEVNHYKRLKMSPLVNRPLFTDTNFVPFEKSVTQGSRIWAATFAPARYRGRYWSGNPKFSNDEPSPRQVKSEKSIPYRESRFLYA